MLSESAQFKAVVLAWLEKQNGNLTHIVVDKVFRFMSNIAKMRKIKA